MTRTHPDGTRVFCEHQGGVGLHERWEAYAEFGDALVGSAANITGLLAPRQERLIAVHIQHHIVDLLTRVPDRPLRYHGNCNRGNYGVTSNHGI